jgi:large subunit ribosomal protein L22
MPGVEEKIVAAKASSRFQRVSARKARLVANLIRGKSVAEAMEILQLTYRPSAGPIVANLLKSAVSNVDHSEYPDPEDLIIGEISVDSGPTMKRFRPRARGRASSIRKRLCHIQLKLVEE